MKPMKKIALVVSIIAASIELVGYSMQLGRALHIEREHRTRLGG